ncbi:adenosine deaminase [Vibrio fluminensis]|uniref:adenosine deaminase n=1 Tax=Vibrio fluminensis TaxID=2783614 RepID=UPI001887C672|nr:adenosine deaminase [Vibrio fluminensis]
MNYLTLPKIDLHCHLDGSVRPETVFELAVKQGLAKPEDKDTIISSLSAPDDCQNLDEYINCFDLPIKIMQTKETLERISFELFEDAANENVKYLEVRFGPLLHQNLGLSISDIIESVVNGMKRAEAMYDIHGNYILSVLRGMPQDQIEAVIDAGAPWLNNGVIAFDIAGSEKPNFCADFPQFTQYAVNKGYRLTVHAGEQWCGQNVYDAVTTLDAERIGHGVHMKDHSQAYSVVKDKAIALEICPTSNVDTKCVEAFAEHPIGEFYRDGVVVTINTDNRTVSKTTMTDEVRKVVEAFKLTKEDYQQIYTNSVNNSFASEQVKQYLLELKNQFTLS